MVYLVEADLCNARKKWDQIGGQRHHRRPSAQRGTNNGTCDRQKRHQQNDEWDRPKNIDDHRQQLVEHRAGIQALGAGHGQHNG
ncbi:hypothetical protein D3C72_2081220 [compost metagenome]